MAVSGTIGPYYVYTGAGATTSMQVYLIYSETVNTSANTSSVAWTLRIQKNFSGNFNTNTTTWSSNVGTSHSGSYGSIPAGSAAIGTYWDIASGTDTVTHDSDGTKTISLSASTSHSNGCYSNIPATSVTLTAIPRSATLTSATDFYDTENPTIAYSNPAGSAVSSLQACISLTGASADIAYRNVSTSGSSYTFPLTDSERNVLRQNTSSASRSIVFVLKTVIGGSTYYSSLTKTFRISDDDHSRPTLSLTATAVNTGFPSKFDGMFIRGKSKVQISYTAVAKLYASISSVYHVLDGVTYTGNPVTTAAFQTSGIQYSSTVTDSRGFSRTYMSAEITYEYTKPQVSPISGASEVMCYRSDASGNPTNNSTTIWIKAKKTFASVNSVNTCTLRYRYRLSSSSSWGGWNSLTTTDNEYNALIDGTFPISNSYVFEIGVVDDLSETASIRFDIPTDDVPLHLGDGGKSVGIGRYADTSEEFSVKFGWKAFFDEGINIGDVELDIGSDLTELPNIPSGVSAGRYINLGDSTDDYYLLISSAGKLYTGIALSGASSITWAEK